jgi:hypothetical protein
MERYMLHLMRTVQKIRFYRMPVYGCTKYNSHPSPVADVLTGSIIYVITIAKKAESKRFFYD